MTRETRRIPKPICRGSYGTGLITEYRYSRKKEPLNVDSHVCIGCFIMTIRFYDEAGDVVRTHRT